jgi:hypothetical protein
VSSELRVRERKKRSDAGMEVARGSNGGKLNPWAEPFVPGSWCRPVEVVAEVEDFSPDWWRLVAASPSFRDRWLRDYGDLGLLDADESPDDDGDLFFSPARTNLGTFLPDQI